MPIKPGPGAFGGLLPFALMHMPESAQEPLARPCWSSLPSLLVECNLLNNKR
jgi:hypothetical protein